MPPPLLFQVGENIAEGVKKCLGHRFCLHFRQYFDYLFSHHIAIVWPSVTAFASVSISASVWTCALIYTSPSVFFMKYCLRFIKPGGQCVERFLGLHIFRFDVSVSMSFNIPLPSKSCNVSPLASAAVPSSLCTNTSPLTLFIVS